MRPNWNINPFSGYRRKYSRQASSSYFSPCATAARPNDDILLGPPTNLRCNSCCREQYGLSPIADATSEAVNMKRRWVSHACVRWVIWSAQSNSYTFGWICKNCWGPDKAVSARILRMISDLCSRDSKCISCDRKDIRQISDLSKTGELCIQRKKVRSQSSWCTLVPLIYVPCLTAFASKPIAVRLHDQPQ